MTQLMHYMLLMTDICSDYESDLLKKYVDFVVVIFITIWILEKVMPQIDFHQILTFDIIRIVERHKLLRYDFHFLSGIHDTYFGFIFSTFSSFFGNYRFFMFFYDQ